jgi:amino acid adenylation domain-containing protein/FkbH-like protein
MLESYTHQEVPFEMVVEAVQPERQTNRTPLFQVFFNMLNFSDVKIELAGLTVTTLLPPEVVSKFDLTLYAREESDLIEFSLTYNTDLFEQNRMVEMLEQLGQLLSEVVAYPEEKVSALSLLTPAAQTLLPNPTEALDASIGEMLYTRFTQHAGRTPTRPAIIDAHDIWSYRELNCRSNQLADFLLRGGVRRHDVVAIYGHRSASLVWAVLGILKAGAAFLILDPAYPASRLVDYVNIVSPAGLLQIEAAGALPSEVEECISASSGCCRLVLPRLSETIERGLLAEYSSDDPNVAVDPGDLAYIAFTSGSTGSPKGIAGEHRPVSHFLQWYSRTFELGETERFSMLSGLAHDPLLRDIFAPLWLGATLCIPGEDEMSGTGRLTEWMKREQVSVAHLVPAMIQLMDGTTQESNAQTATHPAATDDQRALEALRYVFFSGDVLTTRDIWRIRKLAPSATCVNFYGTTETPQAMGYFIVPPQAHDFADELNDPQKIMPIGRGIDDVQLLVLNASQQLAGISELGEIYVRTPYLSRGYVGNEPLTGERFIHNPFTKLAGDRLYRTGDLGRYRPDGQLDFLGRRDQQVKVRGYRIELGEIEAVLTRYPNVREAVVIALEDGTSDKRLVAYVVPTDGVKSAATVALLRAQVEEHLPGYMMPTAFVMLEQMPLTPNGKVDRRTLLERDLSRSSSDRNYVAPRTVTEEILAEAMSHLLKAERVGAHDNFFELGGHSLLAMQLMSRVRESFGVELALRKLFESPTVAGLATQLEQELKAREGKPLRLPPPVRSVAGEKELLLSFAQERLWFQDQLQPGNTFFNLHQAFRLTGRLDVAALEQSLNEVLRRHDALRTTFKQTEGRALQIVCPAQTINLPVTDLSGWPESEREREARQQSDAESKLPCDLATGPLLRVRLVRLAEEEHVVLLTIHHIVSDGWSVGIFIREMALFYESFSGGQRATPVELPYQYADIAAWQREYLQGDALEEQLSYWRMKLDGAAPALSLPTDYPRPPVRSSLGARRTLMLPDGLVRQLKEMNRREGVTLFISMLAALKIVLFKWTQQRDLVVGTVVANRNKLETENLIGCFMNFLPVRSQLTGDETGRELLERVKASVFEMYAHQDCPFEKIVEAVNPERRLNQNPLYNVAFLLQNFPRTYTFSDTLEAAALPTERHTSLLDLRLVAEEVEGGLQLWCEYSTDLFAAETIESFLDNYYQTLEKFAGQSELSLSSFELSAELVGRAAAARRREEKQTVVIASTFTAEPVEESIAFWMQQLDVPTRLKFAPYNQPFQQLLDPSSLMGENENGVNVLLVRMEDWSRHRTGAETKDRAHPNEDHDQFFSPAEIERKGRDLVAAVAASAARTSIPHLLCLCPASPGLADDPLRAKFLAQTEELLASELEKLKGAYVVRASELAALYPVANYYDPHADQLGHIPYTQPFFTALGTIIARKIHALRSAPYKVLVMDCDDTLWKGVCGEDGAQGIELDEARRVLQEFVVAQHDEGMLICLCSKNNEEDVFEVFRCRTEMPLRREHLTAWRVNWQPKSESLKSLAGELNLGLESFILIDNDPVICMEVQANCPEVLTIQLPAEIERIPRFLQHIWAFDRLQVTDEDRKRTAFYQQTGQREHLRNASLNLEDFLSAIELKVRLAPMQQHELARVAQLTERTNQFNVSVIRRSASEIQRLCQTGQFECLVVEASDRFGDYGLVGVVIFTTTASNLKVDTFLLSCRAMGRQVEHRMLAKLGEIALERRLAGVEISFRPTAKNQPALDFLNSVRAKYQLMLSDELTFNFPAADAATLDADQTRFAPATRNDTGAQSSGAADAVFATPQE